MVSTYFLNCIMGNVFKSKTNPALPTNFYLGLSKTSPNMAGGNVTEPVNAGYTRVNLTSALSEPANGVVSNKTTVQFPKSTENWGTITHFVLYDAATGGNFLLSEQLNKSRLVEDSTIVLLEPGGLKFTLTNAS